jgi:NAD(P)H-hydrate epimerase
MNPHDRANELTLMIRLTRAQVREIDRRAIEHYRIPGIILMENAARAAVDVAWTLRGGHGSIAILCGGGNNGGDGLAIARHLHNRGAEVVIFLLGDAAKYQGDALCNYQIVQAMKLPCIRASSGHFTGCLQPALIIDAAFGTGLTHTPRTPFAEIAAAINRWGPPVLAIDLPSGMDCDTGEPLGACIRATQTITFVAEKAGFASPSSREYTGPITVGDIGCPREVIDEILRDLPTP